MWSPISYLADFSYSPYPFALILLLLLRLVSKKAQTFYQLILEAMNLLLAFAAVIYLLQLMMAVYHASDETGHVFKWRITGPYWWAYWSRFLWLLFPLVFWFKKLRTRTWLSIIAAVMALLYLFIERLVILLTYTYRDARPSAWTYYSVSAGEYLFMFAAYGTLVAAVCFLLSRLGKKTAA